MKRRLPLFASLAAVFASFFIANFAYSAAEIGQKAPDFSALDVTGKAHRLSDYKGRHVVLEWVNPGCPFVQKHYNSGNMPATQQEALNKGVVWLAISTTEPGHADWLPPAKLDGWMKARGSATTATLLDEDGVIGKAYGARTTPHLYIVNPQGLLVYAGGIDSIPSARMDDIKTATNYVRQTVGELLAGQPVSQARTRAYGCSIKYKS